MLIFFAVLGGFILDAIFGDPLWLPHPVVYMGKVISFLDRSLRKILPKTPRRAHRRRNHRIHPACRHIPAFRRGVLLLL